MRYLSKEIERLISKKQGNSLVRKQRSCGIFQEYDPGFDQNSENAATGDTQLS
jgi:hypothetical protein